MKERSLLALTEAIEMAEAAEEGPLDSGLLGGDDVEPEELIGRDTEDACEIDDELSVEPTRAWIMATFLISSRALLRL